MNKKKALRINQQGFVIIRLFVDYIGDGVSTLRKTWIGSAPILLISAWLVTTTVELKSMETAFFVFIFSVNVEVLLVVIGSAIVMV